MSDDKKFSLKGLIRLIMGGILVGGVGVAMSVKGWNGFANGEVNVYQKLGPSFIQTSIVTAGAHLASERRSIAHTVHAQLHMTSLPSYPDADLSVLSRYLA